MAATDILRAMPRAGHHGHGEDGEATQLMLEALFDIRAEVHGIYTVVVEPEDDDEQEEEEDT